MTNATDELLSLLDGFEHECFMLRVEATETRARDEAVRDAYERIREKSARAIAATLGGGECENASKRAGVFACSNCGARWHTEDIDLIEPLLLVDGVAEYPSYCQHCGFKIREAVER